jgi:hypothetical protein
MRTRYFALIAFALVPASWLTAQTQPAANPTDDQIETPRQIWQRLEKTLGPLEIKIEKDEIVPSDTDPSQKLRRVEVKFYSQEIAGKKWGHPCVVFIPTDPKFTSDPNRRGKVVIVGQRSWDGLVTGPLRSAYLGNYGEPIAARTGYPTMICPHPGEFDAAPGMEISLGEFAAMKKKGINDLIDHPEMRLATIYLRAMDVMAKVLGIDPSEIRAVIGGHSKRGPCACVAAGADPRILGIVYMGNESLVHAERVKGPARVTLPAVALRWSPAKVLYIGGSNEDGYAMFNINQIVAQMNPPWPVEIVPNYRHSAQSDKHYIDWQMWVAHVFNGRPITKISDLRHEEVGDDFVWGGRKYGAGTLFHAKIDTPNKIIQVKVWYVYNDDEPYWRDLMWYPEFMIPEGKGVWAGLVKGKLPDAWMVEVKDTAGGFPGYLTSLPTDITGKKTAVRKSRGSRSRHWEPK